MIRSIRKVFKQGDSKAITLDHEYVKLHDPKHLEEFPFPNGEILLLPLDYPSKKKDLLISQIQYNAEV